MDKILFMDVWDDGAPQLINAAQRGKVYRRLSERICCVLVPRRGARNMDPRIVYAP